MTWKTLHLVTPHTKNDHVKTAQTLLKQNPYHHFKLPTDGEYGPITASATERSKYWCGYPKSKITNSFGPNLHDYLSRKKKLPVFNKIRRRRRLAAIPKVTTRTKALNLAKTQVGTHESPPGSNDQKYGAWYGANGVAWCAEFQSWCFSHVGRPLHYAYVPYIVADAKAQRNKLSVVHWTEAIPGDLVCFDWPGESPGVADHVGILESINHKTGAMQTIEGNTSLQTDTTGSQSNGGIVAHRTNRTLSEVQAFVRVH